MARLLIYHFSKKKILVSNIVYRTDKIINSLKRWCWSRQRMTRRCIGELDSWISPTLINARQPGPSTGDFSSKLFHFLHHPNNPPGSIYKRTVLCCVRRTFQTKLLPIIIEMATIYLALQDLDLVPDTQIIFLKYRASILLFSEVVRSIFVGRIETVKSYYS